MILEFFLTLGVFTIFVVQLESMQFKASILNDLSQIQLIRFLLRGYFFFFFPPSFGKVITV